jgi:hypothetical protein
MIDIPARFTRKLMEYETRGWSYFNSIIDATNPPSDTSLSASILPGEGDAASQYRRSQDLASIRPPRGKFPNRISRRFCPDAFSLELT